MFEFWHQEPVTLYFPVSREDGVSFYRTVDAVAVVLWEAQDHPGLPACQEAHAELLLKTPENPVSGTRLAWHGKTWDLGRIRICRDLDGNRFCCRCTLV